MSTLSDALTESLNTFARDTALVVALSGGRDSVALLHAAQHYAQTHQRALRAIHINHQLQSAAADFESFCRELCAQWNLPLCVHTVHVDLKQESSIEAAARQSRYQVFEQELRADEVLLIAHHQNDQVETFLLQALRGAGVAGLAAMPSHQSFGRGMMLRPWLNQSRQHIEAYVQQHQLPFIDDPSNDDTRFKRNALRNDVLPVLAQHFPAYEKTLARAAQHCAQANALLDELAKLDGNQCIDNERGSLGLTQWRTLTATRQLNLLRWWISEQGARALSEARLLELQTALNQSDSHRLHLSWDGFQLRCYREHAFILPSWPEQINWQLSGEKISALSWAELTLTGLNQSILISVADLPEKIGELSLTRKDFQQRLGVPEWLRAQIPAIYINQTLCFYGSLWRSKNAPDNVELMASGIGPKIWQRCCIAIR